MLRIIDVVDHNCTLLILNVVCSIKTRFNLPVEWSDVEFSDAHSNEALEA
jgi:hypothetical protein